MISAISVKDRLKNRAAASGKTFQEVLTAYGLERTVYRLSVSEYMERFTLKGGIVSFGDANSRYKDYYDIFILADRYDFDGSELKEAVRETFEHRGTGYDDIFAFTDEFLASELHQSRWKSFLKKKRALVNAELDDVVKILQTLLLPIVDSITNGTDYSAEWDHTSRSWRIRKTEKY